MINFKMQQYQQQQPQFGNHVLPNFVEGHQIQSFPQQHQGLQPHGPLPRLSLSFAPKSQVLSQLVTGKAQITENAITKPVFQLQPPAQYDQVSTQHPMTIQPMALPQVQPMNPALQPSRTTQMQYALKNCIQSLQDVYEKRQQTMTKSKTGLGNQSNSYSTDSPKSYMGSPTPSSFALSHAQVVESILTLQQRMQLIQGQPDLPAPMTPPLLFQPRLPQAMTPLPTHTIAKPLVSHFSSPPQKFNQNDYNAMIGISMGPMNLPTAPEIQQTLCTQAVAQPSQQANLNPQGLVKIAQVSSQSLQSNAYSAGELPNCDDDLGIDSDSSYKDDELFKSMTKNKIKKISVPKNNSSKVIKKRVRNRFGSDTRHMGFVKQFVENEQTGRANQLFQCMFCHIKTPKLCNMLDHQKTHRKEQLFTCPDCHVSFIQKINRDRHCLGGKCKGYAQINQALNQNNTM